MEVVCLFVFAVFAFYFTKCAIKASYENDKNLCKACALILWICTVAQIVKMINF